MVETEVAIIGGGAAGVAAGRRLREAGVPAMILEARNRLGGRAFTVHAGGFALDLGCGWLHSADRNPWTRIAAELGLHIDKTPPPWIATTLPLNFTAAEHKAYREAFMQFQDRLAAHARENPGAAQSQWLEPGNRWNGMIDAVTTYITGVETDRVSVADYEDYDDSGVNWRVTEGYGTAIAKAGAELPATLDCPVRRVDHGGKRLRIETGKGVVTADRVIVALPTSIVADEDLFHPLLPAKTEAARALPLGLDDKLFLSLENAEEFAVNSRIFGNKDRAESATYHFRPFGRPVIECYFGGRNAEALERGGEQAFFDFAVAELTAFLGSAFAKRVKPLATHLWAADPFARGSYAYAVPGKIGARRKLAETVDDRIYFAGEACSLDNFSTAHGAYLSGAAAADAIIAAR